MAFRSHFQKEHAINFYAAVFLKKDEVGMYRTWKNIYNLLTKAKKKKKKVWNRKHKMSHLKKKILYANIYKENKFWNNLQQIREEVALEE